MQRRRYTAIVATAALICGAAPIKASSAVGTDSTFTTAGGPYTYQVPQGANGVQIVAVGAPGASYDDNAGGTGAVVTSYLDPQTAPSGTALTVVVGGPGQGAGFDDGAGGGGASSVNLGPTLDLAGASTVIAGGGGGAGSSDDGGSGGNPDGSGQSGSGSNGGFGGAAGQGGGGTAGSGQNGSGGPGGRGGGDDGGAGGSGPATGQGAGGAGTSGGAGGGGGGGFGGGGAGGGEWIGDGGGGGGSTGPAAGNGTPATTYTTAPAGTDASVTITTVSPVTTLSGRPAASGSVLLDWSDVAQATTIGTTADEVLMAVGDGPLSPTGQISSPATITGLTDGRTYTFAVQTTSSTGISAVSQPITVTPGAPPSIKAVTPASGPPAGGTTITITGKNLEQVTDVRVGGYNATDVASGDTSVTAVTPAGLEGSTDVEVISTTGQRATAESAFSYSAEPPVVSHATRYIPAAGGTPVIIHGSGLSREATVTIGAKPAPIIEAEPNALTVTSPPGKGWVNVEVTNPDGANSGLARAIEYVPAPVLTGLSTAAGTTAGGGEVTLEGSGFSPNSIVRFGSTAATTLTITPTQVTVVAPPGTPGEVDVSVTSATQPPQTSTLQGAFSYIPGQQQFAAGAVGSYTPPAGAAVVSVVAAGGGGADWNCGDILAGGSGAQITASIPVTAGEAIGYSVGGPGTSTIGTLGNSEGASGGGSTNFGVGSQYPVIAGGGGGASCGGNGGDAGLPGGAGGGGGGEYGGDGAPGNGQGGSGTGKGGQDGGSGFGGPGGSSNADAGGAGQGTGSGGNGDVGANFAGGGGGGGYGGGAGGGGVGSFSNASAGGAGGSLMSAAPGVASPTMQSAGSSAPGSLQVTALDAPANFQVSNDGAVATLNWTEEPGVEYGLVVDGVLDTDAFIAPGYQLPTSAGEQVDLAVASVAGPLDAPSALTFSPTYTMTAGVAPTVTLAPIAGSPEVGEQLSAQTADVGGDPGPELEYQWQRAVPGADPLQWDPIPNADGQTYTTTPFDFGKILRVRAIASNGVGEPAEAFSPATSAIAATPPTITSLTITGKTAVGRTIRARVNTTGYPRPTVSYQWQSSPDAEVWTDVVAAIGSTLQIEDAEYGSYLRVVATATNGIAPDATVASSATAQIAGTPAMIAGVNVTGTADIDSPLTASAQGVTGTPAPSIEYAWQSAPAPTGPWTGQATTQTFTAGDELAGQYVRVLAIATNGIGSPAQSTSSVIGPLVGVAPRISGVTVSGTAAVGRTLTASPTGVIGAPTPGLTYRWQYGTASAWRDIPGMTSDSYVVTRVAAQSRIRVLVTASNGVAPDGWTASQPTDLVPGTAPGLRSADLKGQPAVGSVVSAIPVGMTGSPRPDVSFQWQLSSDGQAWVSDPTATESTFTLPPDSAGQRVRAILTASNGVPPAAISVTRASDPIAGPAPEITGVFPTKGPSAGGTALTITGQHFVPGTTVTIAGRACPSRVTRTAITCTSPGGMSGPVAVVVTSPAGQTAASGFLYEDSEPAPSPTLTSPLSPPKLKVKARKASKTLPVGSRSTLVSAIRSKDTVSVEARCLQRGKALSPQKTQRICGLVVSPQRVTAIPRCTPGVAIRVTVTAGSGAGSATTWQRAWQVRKKPRVQC